MQCQDNGKSIFGSAGCVLINGLEAWKPSSLLLEWPFGGNCARALRLTAGCLSARFSCSPLSRQM